MKQGKTGFLVAVLSMLLSLSSLAALPLQVNSYAEPTTIGRDEQVTYTIEITGESGFQAVAPKLPSLTDFSLINMMTSTASNFSIINGNVSNTVTKSFVYRLLPKRTGNLSIPAFNFEIGGKLYSTQNVEVRVLDISRAGTSKQNRGNQQGFGQSNPLYQMDPFDFNPGFEPVGEMEIVATPEKRTVYVGEPLLVTYRLYTTQPVSALELRDEKDFGGYGKDLYSEPTRLNYESVRFKDQRYKSAVIKVLAISPNRDGIIELPQITAELHLGAMGLFSETLQSKPVKVTVKPLPENGMPVNFTGAVGNFKVSDNLKKNVIRVGEALEYTFTITGRGNFNQFSNPDYPAQQDFRIGSPSTVNRIQAGMSGTRTITYLLIPKHEGNYILPGIGFNWFDPASGSYKSFQSRQRSVTVKPGNVLTYISNVFQKESIRTLTPFNPQKNYKTQTIILNSKLYWLVVILILLSLLPSWLIARRERLKETDPELAAQKSSAQVLKKYLKQAENAAREGSVEFYPKAEQGLMRYLSDKYHISHRYSTREKIYQLKLRGLDEDLINSLEIFLNSCQEARFKPGGFNTEGLAWDLENLKRLIRSFIRRGNGLKNNIQAGSNAV